MKIYPPGPVTRWGSQVLLDRVEPLILYTSADGGIQWCINGGLAPMPGVQEGVFLKDGASGLMPPFSFIEHKGARQHGVTVQHTVYDPAEITLMTEFTVPPNAAQPELAAAAIRRVIRDWFESWDPQHPGTLTWVTPDMGRWSCTPRLFRAPPDKQFRAQARRLRQSYTWVVRNDDAFWRGVDSVSEFRFAYSTADDTFTRNDGTTLGSQWAQTYIGAGAAGVCATIGNGYAQWVPSGILDREVRNRLLGINELQTVSINGSFTGGTFTLTYSGHTTAAIAYNATAATVQTRLQALSNIGSGNATVTGPNGGPYIVTFVNTLGLQNVSTMTADGSALTPGGVVASVKVATTIDGAGPTTATDNQVVSIAIGDAYQWPFPNNGFLDIWGRRDNNDANPTGVRARIGQGSITLSRFNSGVETIMTTQPLFISPAWWEDWTLICGESVTAERIFKLYRNRFPVMSFTETDGGSALGASYRGSGWGMKVTGSSGGQLVPPSISEFSIGDNVTITQDGQLSLTNFGSEDGYARFLVYGPGTFRIANGPDSTNMIEFGPLGDGQIALLITLPRKRGVVDLSPSQPTQDLSQFQAFVELLIGFAVGGNVPPLLEWFESLLGIQPPQGELYHLLKGRFTTSIPPKPTGAPPTTVNIACQIVDGNADSKIVAALTPLRRWPE